jgi:hypothetical protein
LRHSFPTRRSSDLKKEKKDLMKRLKHPIRPYPKDASEYNTDVIHWDTHPPEDLIEQKYW